MSSDPGAHAEHPHRCRAGHRWQHAGPTAVTCEIPTYDQISGDLPFISAADCPVCGGRTDLLIRELHRHYCNMCDGEWDHEGRCLDNLAACCPWCFPKADVEPAPGARRGAHFHFCPECGQNWRHAIGCSAPLRAALPECTGCQSLMLAHDADPHAAPQAPRFLAVRALGDRIPPLAVPTGIAAMALLSIAIVLKGYSGRWAPTIDGNPPVFEEHIETAGPAPTPTAPTSKQPTPDLAKPAADSRLAKPVRRTFVPRREARTVPPRVPDSHRPNVLPPPAANPPAPGPVVTEAPPAPPTNPAPSIARSELAPVANDIGPVAPPAAVATPVRANLTSVPGAPPFSGLSGSSAHDASLEGHPRRVKR